MQTCTFTIPKSNGCTNINLKMILVRCYIFSILLYGVETWILNKSNTDKLEAFEMWIYRRILKIPWTDKITNSVVLRRMNKERELLITIKRRKLEYLGHVLRGKNIDCAN
ncbi:unnamed protein product [Diabrotica balteata]|uniref:Reverse transcriptase domain-containing protein n=1 Tax=Diabrotica balteata TaxID=107213 RepID=A0A9N9T543_DIABA|nr:unnamed protein product [Diabrotica balteata]